MFKILFITLITSFFSLQAEEVKTDKQKQCEAKPRDIYEKGLAPCKAGDLLRRINTDYYHMVLICELGTISGNYCILKKEEDFLEVISHSK